MNRFFRRLSLTAKLILVGLIPLALLVFFSIQIYREKTDKIAILGNYLNRTEQAVNLTSVVNELQTERRYSFGFVINYSWQSELAVQRAKTDAAIQTLVTKADRTLSKVETYTFLDSLQQIRRAIDEKTLSPDEVMNYYTNAIFRLNTLNVVSVGNIVYLQPVAKELAGQKLLSEMVTYLGILRSSIYYALYTGHTGAAATDPLKSLYSIYRSYETEFRLKSSDSSLNQYAELRRTGPLNTTLTYIDRMFAAHQMDTSYAAEKWWDVSAAGVDEIRSLQRGLLDKVHNGVASIYQHEQVLRDRTLLFLVLIIALVVFFVMYTIYTISSMLNELNRAAQKISTGATGVPLVPESKDVIGELARSITRIDQNNQALSRAADAIGSGNFEVEVHPRSAEDQLGNAVVRMRNDLQAFNRENSEKLWILGGVEGVNEALRGEKDLATLSRDSLHAVAAYIGAEIGLLYVNTDGILKHTGSYAIAGDENVPAKIRIGETLIGQAAEKKKPVQLTNVPDQFLQVRTGSGASRPKSILIVPLLHNNIVEGVIELGTLDTFSAAAMSFLNQVQSSIAVALQSSKSRARLQELLGQTQSQATELQAQHQELENINAELEAQTEKLQASEEELRVQQEELLQANQELEERSRLLEERNQVIVERNIEIQQKAEELALSTKYKSEFLANMSHELRTPLNSILLLSRLLSENNEQNLSSDQVEYARVIQSSGQGLLSLIDEILDLSKIEAGRMELEYGLVSVEEIVQDMRSLFSPVARERGVDLQFASAPGVPAQLETDKMRLEQVLKNLLSNALKFTSKGFVRLSIDTMPQNPAFLCFTVQDTGIGIPQEKQQLIFEAFQQADGSTRRKFGGTGLGLSISRELVKLLGGEIRVSSEPGKGSSFTVYVPKSRMNAAPKEEKSVAPEPPPAPQRAAASPVPNRVERIPESLPDDRQQVGAQDKTILIVEDDTAFAKALLDFTHKRGYKGLVAVRGDEGIELARKHHPVGILLDIQLPVKNGWEVMEELKADPATRHIPVHIMSSLEVKKESLMKGAVDFINKPVAFEQMQEVFRKLEQVVNKENKKVLIVEENPQHARALAYFLESYDVNAQISGSVEQGVATLQQDNVDCVILDMGIPDQKAYEVLENVKKNSGLEHLPVIIFTGKNLSKTEESRIRQYADSIVVKTAHSYQRILDEVSIFLHLVEESRQPEKATPRYKRLGALGEVLSGKKILIADDDVRNIFSLTRALELHEMQVFSAVDGKEALKMLEEHPDMDMVLMDIMMPEMDGFEAMQEIRKKFQFRNLPIIAVTAKAMAGDREKCIRAGASDYISKPVDMDQLLSLLRVWLYDKIR